MFKLATYCSSLRQTTNLFFLPVFFLFFGATALSAQTFSGESKPIQSLLLGKKFKTFEVFSIDATALAQAVRSESPASEVELQVGQQHWTLALSPNNILSPNYRVRVLKPDGSIAEQAPPTQQKAFKGIEKRGGGRVRLTLDDQFIYGFVESGGETWYIEPLNDFLPAESDKNLFVLYPQSGVVHGEGLVCGTEISEEMLHKYENDVKQQIKAGTPESLLACYEAELAIASDRSMFDKYGSGVENHNIAVINSITPNYASSFIHVIEFVIVTQFVVSGTDPWTNSLDAGTLLSNFRTWGNAGNFGGPFDLGELWTNRNFTGGTIGIAYLDGLCNSFKYHCLQDFSTNADFLRVLCAHEIGHNFNCPHDGSGCPGGFIMCPSVNTSNTWSSTSINAANALIQNRLNSGGCLSPCGSSGGGGGGGTPPTADFSWSPNPACVNQPVTFTDLSTGTYQTRSWVFPGGTPSSSTVANPTVTWSVAGTRNVRLTVDGTNGSSTILQSVVIQGLPSANFTFAVSGTTVSFTNTTPGAANTYLWNFGDATTSTEVDPVHNYAVGGNYTVTLTATNNCGSNTITKLVNTIPTPDFSASPTQGCPPLVVHFTNLSTANATSFQWQFPGGLPATSTVANPTVTYALPGQYDVTLLASNGVGADFVTKVNYITVQETPIANFTFNAVGRTVTFTNTSTNATTYSWNFGDNTPNSTQINPTHTYAVAGTYNVTLTATGPCGTDMYTQTVVIVPGPTASFTAANRTGCAPLVVQYTNTSTGNPTAFSWQFPGGTPSTSTDENPVVIYNTPGSYAVTLVASNAGGSSTATQANYVTVGTPPAPSFVATVGTVSVSFLNTSTNATSYEWDFGDGVTSTVTNPTHTYTTDGSYEVILTAINGCGPLSTSRIIVIVTPPLAGFNAANRNGCAPFSVAYTNTSSANSTSFNWQFPGGTPATSTAQNPTVVYNAPGSYGVTLTVSNAAGSSTATQNSYITVGLAPAAAFSTSVNGLTASFSNSSVNATSYLWNFGNGGTSTQSNPSVTYATDGVYTVTLTATNGCGSNTITRIVTIATPPSAGFTASNTTGCGPLLVQFTNTSSANATTFNWQFAGGNPANSTDRNPAVVYATPGSYSAVLTVSNSAGTSTTAQINLVTVQPPPTAGFSHSNNGAVVTFTNTSTNAVSYAWNFGNGNSSTASNPTYTYPADGTYTVTLTATNPCGSITATQTVVVVTPPTAAFTASNTSGCAPLSVQYTSTSSANATSFNWQFPGGNPASSTVKNPVVAYNTPGTYSVTLTVGNAAGNNTATQTNLVTVGGTPTAGFSYSNNGAVVTFTNTSANAGSYNWNFGNGNSSTASNPTYTYPADGTYTVTLTATNVCGSTTATQTVVVVTPPTAGFTASNTNGCAPLSVQYTSTSSANSTSFNWQFPGGNPASSTVQNPVVAYNTPGTYSATLTVGNAAGNNTATQTNLVTVGGTPTAGFSYSNNGAVVTFTNTSVNAGSYNWNFGNGNSSTASNPTYTYPADGTYTVTLTATNVCGSTTGTQTVVVVTPPTAGFTASNTSGCVPFSVQYTSTSSANSTSFNWQFPGGNPASSTVQNPVVAYNTPGTYSATLTVGNAAGNNTATQTNLVTVGGTPTVGFSYSNNGAVVTFTNTSANAGSYNWNFGNGNSSTDSNPTYTYPADGTYTVTLTATNVCGSTTATQTVVVVTPPTAGFTASNTSGCAPLSVQYTSASSANSTSFNWQFPGGNPAASTAQNPTVAYDAPGTYSAILTVGNAAGTNTATQMNLVTVGGTPTASFTRAVNGAVVDFTNTSVNAVSYEWNFGNGGSSTQQNPTYTYATDGTYTVILTATNACGSTTATQTVVVVTPPTAGFTVANSSGCAPLSVQYTSTSSANATSFNWQFPGGNPTTSTAQNPTVVYNAVGTYAATLTVGNAAGENTVTQTGVATAVGGPAAGFSSSVSVSTATFVNLSTNASTYTWDFGDGTGNSEVNPSHTYTADGTYLVTLTANNACGPNVYTQNVVVLTSPTAGFTANTTIGCGPLTVQFTDLSTSNTTGWNWSFPGGTPASSTQQNPVVVYPNPGLYDVTLIASTGAGSNTFQQTGLITVNAAPAAAFQESINGASAMFVNTSTNANSYTWNFGDGATSSEANPTHLYSSSGNFTVTLVAMNPCGATTVVRQIVIAGPPPVAAFTANQTNGCGPLTVAFSDQSTGSPTAWTWLFQGGLPSVSTQQNPTVVYSIPGNYSVVLVTANAYGADTLLLTNYVHVGGLPLTNFAAAINSATVSFTNLTPGVTTFAWNFGDNTTSNVANPVHTYLAPGMYAVRLTTTNACGSSTIEQVINVQFTGTENLAEVWKLRVFPNPNTGIFSVEALGLPQETVEMALFNALGQLVGHETVRFNEAQSIHTLDYQQVAAGVYSLRLQTGGKSAVVPLVIQQH